ncbi:HTH-type transcriptional regulator PuuR [Aedoeadaptatus ivorii]|uniref:HTH-type transcriptional regulator PuuR n=1 Tax=Aedoeadaptatus ivorii TaxID=54006 RepID=A0A3S4YUY2_9FIRM|nr:XRE family transcriptional regulator [Peptoniphilus ivorii]MDQ0509027.1 transcriptional regulator with XRE-family HTH domain [Peptoniphilus ivorii]VEJ35104.1 HTH-type transcriptional regulator PuuR [Peptoniphilus ivorii]
MKFGKKIRNLRLKQNLTQKELAERSELTKGFISQVERDLTSPSVATFLDICEALGITPEEFFREKGEEKVVFTPDDAFEARSEEDGYSIDYIVPNAQKNAMEPTLWQIEPEGRSRVLSPFEGESFAYILEGKLYFFYGEERHEVKKGDTIYASGNAACYFVNRGKRIARILWVADPPSF